MNLQETEIPCNVDIKVLSIPGYTIEVDNNSQSRRVATNVKSCIKYKRRVDLEQLEGHMIVIDLMGIAAFRIENCSLNH